jgi:hypothetical protein
MEEGQQVSQTRQVASAEKKMLLNRLGGANDVYSLDFDTRDQVRCPMLDPAIQIGNLP